MELIVSDVRSIYMHPLIKKMLDVVFPGPPEVQPSPPIGIQPPAAPAEDNAPKYVPVATADAIGELCFSTGDPQLDTTHSMLIDCMQHGYVKAVRDTEGYLRFGLTEAGQERIRKFYGAT